MTGVQTCALPICFPVTIRPNDENHNKANDDVVEFLNLDDIEIPDITGADSKLEKLTSEYTIAKNELSDLQQKWDDGELTEGNLPLKNNTMKLLVTGGAGFIGSNFVHHILRAYPEYEVVTLDDLTYAGNLENLQAAEGNDRHRFVKGSITDATLVDQLVAACDIVVHFAAESHVDRSIMNPGTFVETNVHGTYVLLGAAKKHGKRFHHVSTDEVFGALGKDDALS